MTDLTVASTEFQNRAGLYIEHAARHPVFITKHRRRARVLIDIAEYERLKARDTRQAYFVEELPEAIIETIRRADYGHIDPALDALMD